MLVSLKKYLDMSSPVDQAAETGDLFSMAVGCYRNLVSTIGRSAVEGCPAVALTLEQDLQNLDRRLSIDPSSELLRQTEEQIEIELKKWGERTARHLKAKADEVKELLLTLAKTAESLGDRNEGYTKQFQTLTAQLESIADLDDLSQVRTSLTNHVSELKKSVAQMARDSQQVVGQLKAEVSFYENRLKEVESLVLKDELTGLANRRSVEERIQLKIAKNEAFCVLMLDLNSFKQVNDLFGHQAGDDLLRQFAAELRACTRNGDLVGRWGGDEFIVVLDCDAPGASTHIQRISEWVFGKYKVHSSNDNIVRSVQADAAVGLAEWRAGQTIRQLIAQADSSMYRDKEQSRQQNTQRSVLAKPAHADAGNDHCHGRPQT